MLCRCSGQLPAAAVLPALVAPAAWQPARWRRSAPSAPVAAAGCRFPGTAARPPACSSCTAAERAQPRPVQQAARRLALLARCAALTGPRRAACSGWRACSVAVQHACPASRSATARLEPPGPASGRPQSHAALLWTSACCAACCAPCCGHPQRATWRPAKPPRVHTAGHQPFTHELISMNCCPYPPPRAGTRGIALVLAPVFLPLPLLVHALVAAASMQVRAGQRIRAVPSMPSCHARKPGLAAARAGWGRACAAWC